jgi:hypothetical protein
VSAMIGNPLMLGSADYQITRSLRFRSSASAYLSRTPASTTNRTTWTWSAWVKRGAIGSATMGIWGVDGSTNYMFMILNNSGTNNELDCGELATTQQWRKQTTQVFRDASSWYHLVLAFDSTQATASNRVKIYVNGSQVTAFAISADPSLNYNSIVNTTTAHSIGRVALPTGFYFDGYLAEVNFIDGQALTPSSFGETDSVTGAWLPKKFTGTYGTNGFYLPFTDNSGATSTTIGKDYSVNGNNWTPNNISVTSGETYDSMTDVPTLTSPTAANYCVLNPLRIENVSIAAGTISDGNLKVTTSATNAAYSNQYGSMAFPTSGGWYYEAVFSGAFGNLAANYVGIVGNSNSSLACTLTCTTSVSIQKNFSNVQTGLSFSPGDVLGVAFDATNLAITFYKNGSILGSQVTGLTSAEYIPFVLASNGAGTQSNWVVNFGQRPFAYTPPSGFVALNTFNLPTPAISAGNKHMNATLYTGNGSTQSIVNSGSMQPDLLWTKARSSNAYHYLQDSVRGVNKAIFSNGTDAEYSISPTTTTINSNGFSFNGGESGLNANTVTYVAWQWKANGAGSSNTAGSITSTVSANTTSGFSVVTYTGNGTNGATVGHGLGVTPSLLIFKARGGTNNWVVTPGNSTLFGGSFYLQLNTNSAVISNSNIYTSYPSSSVFYLGTSGDVNTSSATYVAYCFAPIAGFSAFGSYTGNGSTDGPFIYTGFRPRWILQKRTSGVGEWRMWDTSRQTFNVVGNTFNANTSDAEYSGTYIDILSNGFKLRVASVELNGSGDTYIYAAFAENPFKYSLAR